MIANESLQYGDKSVSVIQYRLNWLLWQQRLPLILVAVVILTGLGLRLFGLGYGLPYFYGPPDVRTVVSGFEIISPFASDELQFVDATMRLLARQTLNPEYFAQPGTPLMYLGALVFAVIIGMGMLVGVFPDLEAASLLYRTDPTVFYFSFRLLVAVIDVGSIALIYALGRRLFSHRAGLIAALLYAVSPVNLYIAKTIRADTLMLFFILAALWFCLDMLQKQSWRSYALAGFFTGLAIVSKYPAATFIPVIVAVHLILWQQGKADPRKLLVALLGIGVGAFMGSPYAFLDYPAVLAAVAKESENHLSGASEGFVRDIVWYMTHILPLTLSLVGSLLAGVGALWCVRSADWRHRLLLLFPVIFLVFISTLGIRWERWLVPVIPFAGLLAGYTVDALVRWLQRQRPLIAFGVWVGLFALMFVPLLQTSLLYGTLLNHPETRTIARQWLIENIPPDSRVLIERHGPQPPKSLFTYYEEHDWVLRPVDVTQRPFNNLYAYGEIGNIIDLDSLAAAEIEYLILSDFYDRYRAEADLFGPQLARYEEIRALGEIIYEIAPVAGEMSGPRVTVIALTTN